MYSWEIYDKLREYNNYIGGDDLLEIISQQKNPQLTSITFNAKYCTYYMEDNEGNTFNFKAMPYEEAKAKGLVKVRK